MRLDDFTGRLPATGAFVSILKIGVKTQNVTLGGTPSPQTPQGVRRKDLRVNRTSGQDFFGYGRSGPKEA